VRAEVRQSRAASGPALYSLHPNVAPALSAFAAPRCPSLHPVSLTNSCLPQPHRPQERREAPQGP
jgi:hypothetical protein